MSLFTSLSTRRNSFVCYSGRYLAVGPRQRLTKNTKQHPTKATTQCRTERLENQRTEELASYLAGDTVLLVALKHGLRLALSR